MSAHSGPRGEGRLVHPPAPWIAPHTHTIPTGAQGKVRVRGWEAGLGKSDTRAWTKQDAAPPSRDLSIPPSFPPSPADLLPLTAPPPSSCSLCLSPHLPSFSFSAPLPLGGLSIFSLSLSCGPPLFTGQASLSHCSLSASPPPTRTSPQGLSSTGAQPLHSAGFALGPETKEPGGPEPNRDGHECCSGPSPALFPWPHIVLVHQVQAPDSPSSLTQIQSALTAEGEQEPINKIER